MSRKIYKVFLWLHREVRLSPCEKKISQYGQTMSQLNICMRSSLLQNLRELIYEAYTTAGKMFFTRCSALPACQVSRDHCWTRQWHRRQSISLTNPSVQTVGTEGNLVLFCRFFIVWFNKLYKVKTAGVHHLPPRRRVPGPTAYTRSSSNWEMDSWLQRICFLRGPEILMEINTYKISGNLVINFIIIYLLILCCPDYTQVFCKYMTVATEL